MIELPEAEAAHDAPVVRIGYGVDGGFREALADELAVDVFARLRCFNEESRNSRAFDVRRYGYAVRDGRVLEEPVGLSVP